MGKPVSTIRNLGPASEELFLRAGIPDAETLIELGADAAYSKLIKTGTRPHFIGYYALVMGLQGRPWNDCQGDEKKRLRVKFDMLKTTQKAPLSDIEKHLDKIGVIEK